MLRCIYFVNTNPENGVAMERHLEHRGTSFVWDEVKAELNVHKLGVEGDYIRIISARRATASEEAFYGQ
jgi:hypothetical protein